MITEDRYHSLHEGDDIAILYLPDRQDEAWVAEGVYSYSASGGWVVTAVLFSLAALFMFLALRSSS